MSDLNNKYIIRSCALCSWNEKLLCNKPKAKACSKYLPRKASCLNCIRLRICLTDGIDCATNYVCEDWQRNVDPPSSIYAVKIEVENAQDSANSRGGFSPLSYITDIIDSDFSDRNFVEIDDRDFPRAKNPIDFIENPKFMATNLFARQMQVVIQFLACACPYCSDMDFLKNKIEVDTPLGNVHDRMSYYGYDGVCPKCKRTKFDAFSDSDPRYKLRMNNNLVGVVGQRGGKSALSAVLAACIVGTYLTTSGPSEFGVLDNSMLGGTFVALTFGQAFKNIWQPFYGLITGKPWFRNYWKYINEKGNKLGRKLIKLNAESITIAHRNLFLAPEGPDKRILRGETRLFYILDELGWFFSGTDSSVKYDPDEIYRALTNSLMTLRSAHDKMLPIKPYLQTGYAMHISSPSSKHDMSMRLLQVSKSSDKMHGFKFASWEFNPTLTRKSLEDELKLNPQQVERDFGANPPFANSPFITSPATIIPQFTNKINCLQLGPLRTVNNTMGTKLLAPPVIIRKKHSRPSLLALDCGHSQNSFALVLMHRIYNKGYEAQPQGIMRRSKDVDPQDFKIAVSGVLNIVPDPYPISFEEVYTRIMEPIIEAYDVRMLVYDRWQSKHLGHRAFKDHELDYTELSINYSEFEDVRSRFFAEGYVFPQLELPVEKLVDPNLNIDEIVRAHPVSTLFLETLMSEDTGRTITKNVAISDDVLRALSIGTVVLEMPDYQQFFIETKYAGMGAQIDSIATMASFSKGNARYTITNKNGSNSMGCISTYKR